MKKEIFDALKAKFPNAAGAILDRIAEKLAKTVTDSSQVASAVERVTQEFIDIINSYGDSRATEAQQTAVHNYETKYGLKDGAKIDGSAETGGQAGGSATAPTQAGGAEEVPAWAKAIIESNKTVMDRLNKMDAERTTATRRQQLSAVIDKLPEHLRKGYSRISVDSLTDEQFSAMMGEVAAEVDGIVKSNQQKGAVFGRPSLSGGMENKDGELTKEQQDAIAHRDSKTADGQPF